MVDRLLLALIIVTALFAVYRLAKQYSLQSKAKGGLELDNYHIGRPAILYFTTPGCVPCMTIQRPALARAKEIFGDGVQIIEVDALSQPNLADRWGVLSVPTTFIIDAYGRPRRVNHGTAKSEKLIRQLNEISTGDSQSMLEVSDLSRTVPEQTLGMD